MSAGKTSCGGSSARYLPINLFDAMRVIAERVDPGAPARTQDARYDFAVRHARVACSTSA